MQILQEIKSSESCSVSVLPLSITFKSNVLFRQPSNQTQNFFKHDFSFRRLLPYYVDDGNVLQNIDQWIFSQSKDTEIMMIEDNPGLGKSTAPLAAACEFQIGYAVFEPGVGVLCSIQNKVDYELNANFPNGGLESEIVEKMTAVFLHGFIHLFNECAQYISKTNKVVLYKCDLNDYDGSQFVDDRMALTSLAARALKDFEQATAIHAESKRASFLMHFDEMQQWSTIPFRRDDIRFVEPQNYRTYYLLALCEAMLYFKGKNIRFILSGTNIEQGRVIRCSSQVKVATLTLPLFSVEGIIQLLSLICNVDHLDTDGFREKIAAPLVGCVRSCEYFLDAVYEGFNLVQAEQVTVQDLEKCVNRAYTQWSADVGMRYQQLDSLVDDFLLAFMFPVQLGGNADKDFPNSAINFPRKNIPPSWIGYAESGALRIQTVGDDEYRLWKPYHFLMEWMRRKTTIFEFKDVQELWHEIGAGSSVPQKRKGYCFQRAVSLELVNPQTSQLWKLIIKKLHELGLDAAPVPLTDRKVLFFKKNSEIVQDRVCNAQDEKNKGEKTNTKKRGDICGMRVKDSNGEYWDISIEAKNYSTPHNNKLIKFYERSYKRNTATKKEISIYLSLNPMAPQIPAKKSRMKTHKVFLLIDGLQKGDCSLDIQFLSSPGNSMSLEELKGKLSIGFTPNLVHAPGQQLDAITFFRGDDTATIAIPLGWTIGNLRSECEKITGLTISQYMLATEDNRALPTDPTIPLDSIPFLSSKPRIEIRNQPLGFQK